MSIDINQANEELASLSAEGRILWGVEHFGMQAVLMSSMQKTASVLMHLFAKLGLRNEILFGDTGFHFHETLQLRDQFMRQYGLNIVTLYPKQTPIQQEELYGRKLHLFVDGQPVCCKLRKEDPYINYVRDSGVKLIIKGLRNSEGGKRGNLRYLMKDARTDTYDLHPIMDWKSEQVAAYLKENDVPVHPLHAQSYPSIGCQCCTTPVQPGEDARAGRWRHLRTEEGDGPQYCGINYTDGSGI